jgi:hypothetical protein
MPCKLLPATHIGLYLVTLLILRRTSVTNAIKIFTQVPGAEDRVSRSYFRKHLILKELGRDEKAGEALCEARRLRQELTSQETCGDTIQEYDSLVSYYNK